MNSELILGGPGSGKTHSLLSILEDEFAGGVRPDRVAFCSFTRAAVQEAKERVVNRFSLDPKSLIYCRTLHSLSLRCLGLSSKDVMNWDHFQEFGKFVGCAFSRRKSADPFSGTDGDRGIHLINLARATCQPLRAVWERHGEHLRWHWLRWLAESLREFKKSNFLVDYADMLAHYCQDGKPLDLDVAIIDEAQDLSTLQWKVAERAFANVKRLYIAGDDDQAVHKWAGADVGYFLDLDVDKRRVLPFSHRLAPEIYRYSQNMIRRVKNRYEKDFKPKGDKTGQIIYHRYVRGVPIDQPGTWLLLARNKMFLKHFEEVCREHGRLYTIRGTRSISRAHREAIQDFAAVKNGDTISGLHANALLRAAGRSGGFKKDQNVSWKDLSMPDRPWHEVLEGIPFEQRVYYLTAERRGVKLDKEPRIRLDTIHAVKGAEADHVALISDITTKTQKNLEHDQDDERRVWYVGATRTRGNLHIILPNTPRAFNL